MSKVIHYLARREAHSFVELFYNDLPESWTDNVADNQFDLELWLACFDVTAKEESLRGFALLNQARVRAEKKYKNDFKQAHHTLPDWAFYRFRLEMALLNTVGASVGLLNNCYAHHTALAFALFRISPQMQDRRPYPLN